MADSYFCNRNELFSLCSDIHAPLSSPLLAGYSDTMLIKDPTLGNWANTPSQNLK